jgi:tetratricopeptide (TPR) repeat protein
MRVPALVIILAVVFQARGVPAATFSELAAQAAAARDANNLSHAIDLYRQALALNPAWPEGWWSLGTLYYDSDQYANGQEAFARLVKLSEYAAPAWAFLGLCEFETGRYAESTEHIRRGLALRTGIEPAIADVLHFHEALLLTRAGLFDQAQRGYIPLAQRGSKDPTLIAGIGLTALHRAMLPKEVPAEQRELVMASGKTAYLWMAGDPRGAEEGFRSLLAAYPAAPGVHYFYGSYLLESDPEQAMAEFKRELAINTGSADARAMIAFLMVQAGDESGALPFARKAVEDAPSAPVAHYTYGLILAHQGDGGAIQQLEAAEQLDPANLEYHTALAGAYSKFGRREDARRERLASIALARQGDAGVQR